MFNHRISSCKAIQHKATRWTGRRVWRYLLARAYLNCCSALTIKLSLHRIPPNTILGNPVTCCRSSDTKNYRTRSLSAKTRATARWTSRSHSLWDHLSSLVLGLAWRTTSVYSTIDSCKLQWINLLWPFCQDVLENLGKILILSLVWICKNLPELNSDMTKFFESVSDPSNNCGPSLVRLPFGLKNITFSC